jgi:hypothetical protein
MFRRVLRAASSPSPQPDLSTLTSAPISRGARTFLGEMRFSVLEASEVGGEAGEVAFGGAVVALGLGLQLGALRPWSVGVRGVSGGRSWRVFSGDEEKSVS